jgi:hypothetical protein
MPTGAHFRRCHADHRPDRALSTLLGQTHPDPSPAVTAAHRCHPSTSPPQHGTQAGMVVSFSALEPHCRGLSTPALKCPSNRGKTSVRSTVRLGSPGGCRRTTGGVSASPARPPTPSTLSNEPPSAERSAAEARSTSPSSPARPSEPPRSTPRPSADTHPNPNRACRNTVSFNSTGPLRP